jgi:hypothetical protein
VTDQPTVIFATGVGGNTLPKPWTKLKIGMINEITAFDSTGKMLPGVEKLVTERKAKGFKMLDLRKELRDLAGRFTNNVVRPMYLHEDESKTLGQLEGFVRHEMGTRQAKALQIK